MDAIIISKEQALKYRQLKFDWWWGIDATELKDGTFFISKKCYDLIPEGFKLIEDGGMRDVKDELSMLATKKLRVSDFKVAEIDTIKK